VVIGQCDREGINTTVRIMQAHLSGHVVRGNIRNFTPATGRELSLTKPFVMTTGRQWCICLGTDAVD